MSGAGDWQDEDSGSERSSFAGYTCPRSVPHCAELARELLAGSGAGSLESARSLIERDRNATELLAIRQVDHWVNVLIRFREIQGGATDFAEQLTSQFHGRESRATLYEVLVALAWRSSVCAVAALAQAYLVLELQNGWQATWAQPLNALMRSGVDLMLRDADGRVPVHVAARSEGPSDIMADVARLRPAALLVPDTEGRTALDEMADMTLPTDAASELLARAVLECSVTHAFQTQQLLQRSKSAEVTLRNLAKVPGCGGLLLAVADGSSSEAEMARLTEEAAVQEGRSAEQLSRGLCRVSLLKSLTAQAAERRQQLEPEELQLKVLHLEAVSRQREEEHKRAMAAVQEELDRVKSMLLERDREIVSLQAAAAAPRAQSESPVAAVAGEAQAVRQVPHSAVVKSASGEQDYSRKAEETGVRHPVAERDVVDDIRRSRRVGLDLEGVPGELQHGLTEMRASLTAAVTRLTHDIYESEVHFLQELVQNADDNSYAQDVVPHMDIHLRTTGSMPFFYTANNELGLAEKDVRAICDIARSSKQAAAGTTTGCKGIGFKSVFRVCNEPHVLSHAWRFKFSGEGLGMLTPQWVDDEAYAALPEEVRAAHSAGRTIIYLPLAQHGAVESIEAEMRMMQYDSAQLLFLRRLREVSLHFAGGATASLAARIEAGARTSTTCEAREAAVAGGDEPTVTTSATRFEIVTRDDVTVALPLTDEPTAQRIYSFLPVRTVGFNFAVQAPFLTTASRTDFHRTPDNARRRDAIAPAFLGACSANQEVANRALKYLGHEPVEPFWRAAWLDIVVGLGNVPCVQTAKNGLAEPARCLVRGDDPVVKWISDELLFDTCGLYFAAPSNPKEMLQHLGVRCFGFQQLQTIVLHEAGALLQTMWLDPLRSSFFSDLYSSFLDSLKVEPALIEVIFELPVFPLASTSQLRRVPAFNTVSGLYLNFVEDIPVAWQEVLVPVVSKDVDLSRRAMALLTALRVEDLDEAALEEAALKAVLLPKHSGGEGFSAIRTFWSGLCILCRTFLQGRSLSVGWTELGPAMALPGDSGLFKPARLLRLCSCLGIERVLPEAISEDICSFVAGSAAWSAGANTPRSLEAGGGERVMRPPFDTLDVARNFEWEVFLWTLGCQVLDLRSRSTAESVELSLKLGGVLVSGDFWQRALQIPRAMDYVAAVLSVQSRFRVSCWLRRLPVFFPRNRSADVRDMFLFDAFHTLGGSHLDYVTNIPNSSEVLRHLRGLGVSVDVTARSLRKCVHTLRARKICDIGVLADIYGRLHVLGFQPEDDEPFLLVPTASGGEYRKRGECSWESLEDRLLQHCSSVRSLQEHYSRFGSEVCNALQRWVRNSPADDVEVMCNALATAVDFGQVGFGAGGIATLLAGRGPLPTREDISRSLVAACKSAVEKLAATCVMPGGYLIDSVEDAFSPTSIIRRHFTRRPLIVVPGTAPAALGAPTPSTTMAYVRTLRPREAYWDVDPELSEHPCSAWALTKSYGTGPSGQALRLFFTQVLSVQQIFSREDLKERLRPTPGPLRGDGPGVVEQGLDFREHPPPPRPRPRPVGEQRPVHQGPEVTEGPAFPLGLNNSWRVPRLAGPPGRHYPPSVAEQSQRPETAVLPGRHWRRCGEIPPNFAVYSVTGQAPIADVLSFDLRPLFRALNLAFPTQARRPAVVFAYDPSGRCVSDVETNLGGLVLDYRSLEHTLERDMPFNSAVLFWVMELAHAMAHRTAGPHANHGFLVTYRDHVVAGLATWLHRVP